MLVSIDNTPANRLADATASQFTSVNTVDTPIVATAVCATVLIALIIAHLSHCLKLFFK